MSDEAVIEDIISNEREFDVDPETGKLDESVNEDVFKSASREEAEKRRAKDKAARIASGSVFFEDLDEEDQELAIEKTRQNSGYLDYSWWDGDIGEDWKDKDGKYHRSEGYFDEQLAEKGFENTKINFSGFCSQGDGACFSCTLDVKKIVETYNIVLRSYMKSEVDDIMFYGEIKTSGNYCHSGTMEAYVSYEGR